MDSGVYYYLSEVLGIQSMAVAAGAVSPAVTGLAVVTLHRLESDEKLLADKMLAAIGCQDVTFYNQETWQNLEVEKQNPWALFFGLEGAGGTQSNGLYLPALQNLLGDTPAIRELKKQVWTQLKEFKIKMEQIHQ